MGAGMTIPYSINRNKYVELKLPIALYFIFLMQKNTKNNSY
jgi:hypothetical protein